MSKNGTLRPIYRVSGTWDNPPPEFIPWLISLQDQPKVYTRPSIVDPSRGGVGGWGANNSFLSPEPRSLWPAAGIESSGFVQHRKSAIHPSNLAYLIGWEYETTTLQMLRKSGPARALDPCRRSEWSWLWGREWEQLGWAIASCLISAVG